jgi:hypothetical protein
LREFGLWPVVKRKHQACHRRERLQWAERCKEYTMEDWKRVLWTDEIKINCLGSDGRKWVWKEVRESH